MTPGGTETISQRGGKQCSCLMSHLRRGLGLCCLAGRQFWERGNAFREIQLFFAFPLSWWVAGREGGRRQRFGWLRIGRIGASAILDEPRCPCIKAELCPGDCEDGVGSFSRTKGDPGLGGSWEMEILGILHFLRTNMTSFWKITTLWLFSPSFN